MHQKLLERSLVSNACVFDEDRLVKLAALARQTQRGEMLAAVLKGASLEAFALKLSELPSADDDVGAMAMHSDGEELVVPAGLGAGNADDERRRGRGGGKAGGGGRVVAARRGEAVAQEDLAALGGLEVGVPMVVDGPRDERGGARVERVGPAAGGDAAELDQGRI